MAQSNSAFTRVASLVQIVLALGLSPRPLLICSEVSVNRRAVGGIPGVSPEEEKGRGYGGKDLQERKVLSLDE